MIGLSPLSTGHPPSFQPRWVRPSTGSYPRFSLPMDSSPSQLNLATDRNSLAHSTKGTPSHSKVLRLLVGTRFQVLFHSPPGVLFTFPSRYWSTIGHRRVFRLGGWSPLLPTGFHVSGGTRVPVRQSSGIRVRGSNPVPPAFPGRSASARICNCATTGPTTPTAPEATAGLA